MPIDLERFRTTPLATDPFDHLIVPGFIRPEATAAINADFPAIDRPGSFPVSELTYGPQFRALLDALYAPEMTQAFADKFALDLGRRPIMVTVRGQAQAKDGRIHTDSKTKVITVLIYMNPSWEASGGRLRLLRSPDSLDNPVVEVPPEEGTLLAFRNGPTAWHGHERHVGQRRSIQLNWVTDEGVVQREQTRHRFSARMKRLFASA
ncbi:MAG: 2OG-Fe(II) oxygenase [Rhodospirillaceae bacterium]|nr:2OG-Fe(II) oxygenase [Rhodospirillaceae bacterium]